MATHSSILAWRIPMDRGTWQAYSPWSQKELDMIEWLSNFTSLQGIKIPHTSEKLSLRITSREAVCVGMCVCVCVKLLLSCPTLCDPMDCSLPSGLLCP